MSVKSEKQRRVEARASIGVNPYGITTPGRRHRPGKNSRTSWLFDYKSESMPLKRRKTAEEQEAAETFKKMSLLEDARRLGEHLTEVWEE